LQEECRQIVREAGASPLILRLIAGAIRNDARLHGRDNATDTTAWRVVRGDWQQRAAAAGKRREGPVDYCRPFLAYAQSCENLQPCERHLVATLAHFPPAQLIPSGAVRLVWRDTLPAGDHMRGGDFKSALEALERASILDTHPFQFHGTKDPCGALQIPQYLWSVRVS